MNELEEKIELITKNKKVIDKLDSKFYLDETNCDTVSVRNICGIPLNGKIFTDEDWDRMKIVIDGEEFEITKGNREIARFMKNLMMKQISQYIVSTNGNSKEREASQRFMNLTNKTKPFNFLNHD